MRIALSVRPAIGISRNASGTRKSTSNAVDIPRTPAPPVSTSVPSMSKRITFVSRRVSAFAANVSRPRAFRGRLLLEVDALPFVQLVEAALHGTSVKEPLLTAVVAYEPKTPVTNESLDRAARHPSLLGRACPESWVLQVSFHLNISERCGVFRHN